MADGTIPFDYLERFKRTPSQQPDPVNATINAVRAEQVRQGVFDNPDPEKVARVTRLSRESGDSTLDVDGRENDVQTALNARKFSQLAEQHVPIGKWAVADPRGAAAASDDHESLGILSTAWDFIKNAPSRLVATGGSSVVQNATAMWNNIERLDQFVLSPVHAGMSALSQVTGIRALDPGPVLRADEKRRARNYDAMSAQTDKARDGAKGANSITEGLLQGLESVPLSLIGAMTGNPYVSVGALGGGVASTSFEDATRKGLTGIDAANYAVLQGSTEAITEFAPASTLVSLVARKTPWGKAFVNSLAQEMTGEQVATVVQDLTDWAYLPENRSKTVADYLNTRPAAAVQTALGVIGSVGATHSIIGASQRATDASVKVAGRIQDVRQAKAERGFLDQAAKAADTSKLKQRDPEAFRALVRAQAEDAGSDTVFVPGEAVRAYKQSDGYDADQDPFDPRNWQEADATGGDLVMPIEDFLTDVVGTPAWDAIKDDVRLTQGGMSTREAQTFEEAFADLIGQAADDMAQADRAEQSSKTVRDKLVEQVAGKFGGSFTSPVARQYAEIAVQRAQTRAARLGLVLTGNEFSDVEVRQVMPESVAQARQADRLDLVINAMRQGGDVEYGVGPSLLEFIKQRGGVNDTGGDLASMGVPSKYLTGFDPRQTEMTGGLSGQGDYGLDNTLQAAITAGYFPDLVGAENEAGPSTIDTQRLLDAIGQEISGKPVYSEMRTDDLRAAGEDLRQMLDNAGLAYADMSDTELRNAIEGMAVKPTLRGKVLFHGSSKPDLAITDVEVIRKSGQKQGKKGRVYGGFYGTEKLSEAQGYAEMSDGVSTIYEIELTPDAVIWQKQGDITRLSADFIDEATARGVDVVVGKDPRGRTEYAIINRDAIARIGAPNSQTTYQQEARGQFSIEESGRRTIELFQGRNLSTPIHELGHMWLEELRFDASLPEAPEQVKADWQAVQQWFARSGHTLDDAGAIPVDAHELFARGIETYFMEGKAPTSALTRIFENVRQWMIGIYRTVQNLRAPINPEIREVFDRMLATDQEIADARERQGISALFKDAASVGMNEAEFAAYQAQADEARAASHAKLLDKTMRAIRRRETERYREARKGVRDEQQERIDASPLYRALSAMKADRIDRGWIVDRMGLDALDLLPKRVPPLFKDGGANPETLAEMSGYRSASDMIESLIGAETAHRQAKEGGDPRSMRERAIETATDEEMNRRYGDPLNDGSIEREALAAVQSEQQGEVIAAEIRVLGRNTGRRPTPYAIARDWARGKVRSGRWVDEVSPGAIQRHARNAAKAGRAAEEAMAKGDQEEAYRQKQFQMLNSALVTEAKAASEDVEAAVKRMDKIARTGTRKSVDQDYLEQAQTLLEAVDLRKRTQIYEKRKGKFAAWAAAREAEGYDVVVPDSFEATLGQTNWSQLPADAILTLDEAVKQILHLGRLKQTLLDNQEEREWDAIEAEAVDGAGNIKGKPPADLAEPDWWEGVKRGVLGADAALLKMETVFDWLDGGNPNGVFNRIAFRPVADAQAREQDMLKDYYSRIKGLFEAVPAKAVERWNDIETPPFIDPHTERPMRANRKQLVAMALNVGNEGNLQRLADGYRVNPEAVIGYLDETLTADEWKFVQGVWDTIDTLWPEIEGLERRVNGIAPEKIAPREFMLGDGTRLKGGYYPAIYDSSRDYRAEENRGKESDLFEGRYTRATTRASSTKERAEKVSRPILLDLGVINRHLGEVIHDVTHREAVIRANRFLSSERVRRAVDGALGQEIGKQFRPWVKHVANAWAMERAGNEGVGKFFGKLRSNAVAVGMGFRLSTAMTQIAGFSNSFEVVGEKWVAEAIARSTAHPIETFAFVMERSDEMRHRMDSLDRDIRSAIERLDPSVLKRSVAKVNEVKRFMFHGIGYMDRAVTVPTWLGAYNKAIAEGMSEADAAYAADKAIRVSQGSGSPKDLAAVVRGTGQWGKLLTAFTMFYSFFSAQYQRQRTLARDVIGSDSRRPRNFPKLLARAWWLVVVPAILPDLIKMATSGNGGPDDDEWWAAWAAKKFLSNSLGPIPGLRDLIEPAWDAAAGNKSFGYSLSPLQRIGETFVNVAKDGGRLARGDDTKHATKNALEAAGYATGLVPGQIASAVQFLVDVGDGDADPEGFSQWFEGLTTGKIKDD